MRSTQQRLHRFVNYAKNAFDSATGGDAKNNFETQGHAVADELSSFMKGAGHSSDTEIQQWKESLSPNMSPQQQRGAIKTLMGIYDHALSALEDKRTGAIGSVAAEKMRSASYQAGTGRPQWIKCAKWVMGSDWAHLARRLRWIDRSRWKAEMKRRGLF